MHVVVGAGITGLFTALKLAEGGADVTLIERAAQPGGLLAPIDAGPHGRFDQGMHNMYETGIPALDELQLSLLPTDKWQMLEGPGRDLAGIFFNGRLQTNTLSIDLREHPNYEDALGGLFARAGTEVSAPTDAQDRARQRFGVPIATRFIEPVVEKLFGCPADKLAPMAMDFTSLHRVVLFDEPTQLDLMRSDWVRSRTAFPEQRNLPESFSSGRKAFYPKDYGIYRIIDALVARVEAVGVRLLTDAQVKDIVCEGTQITKLRVTHGDGQFSIDTVERLYWTAGVPSLANTLGVMEPALDFDQPPHTVAVNLLLDRPPEMGGLFYFYGYDPGFETFRVTDYGAYSSRSKREGGYPVCVELLVAQDDPRSTDELAAAGWAELQRFGVVDGTACNYARADILQGGFPLPTTRNIEGLDTLRGRLDALALANLTRLGVLSEPGLFFQSMVLAHAWRTLEAL